MILRGDKQNNIRQFRMINNKKIFCAFSVEQSEKTQIEKITEVKLKIFNKDNDRSKNNMF